MSPSAYAALLAPSHSTHCLRRKLDKRDSASRCLSCFANAEGGGEDGFARIVIENEAEALRETLASHKKSVQKLLTELEEERSASLSAATEAMSMILRLQREKAEGKMEARQFWRLAEEKMSHAQQEIAALEDILFKRDQTVQALICEVKAYRHRLLSYGIGVDEGTHLLRNRKHLTRPPRRPLAPPASNSTHSPATTWLCDAPTIPPPTWTTTPPRRPLVPLIHPAIHFAIATSIWSECEAAAFAITRTKESR